MSDDVVFPEDQPRKRRRGAADSHDGFSGHLKKLFSTSFAGIIAIVIAAWFIYNQFRIEVGTGEMAILIRKTGLNMENGSEIAESPKHKGVQREFLTEGRYFRNPYTWDWEVIKQTVIPEDKMGILVSLEGEDLPYGEFLAHVDEQGNPTTKGIMPGVLKPGRYPIHPYLFDVEYESDDPEKDKMFQPVIIKSGFRGVVTNLAGPMPEDPNQLLVPDGYRGVQEKVLDEGTYYFNPYEQRVSLMDCRSQRFNLAEKKDMGFPSKDGFWVSLDGIIEFRVQPEHAATVYVTYNELVPNGDAIDEEIIRKIIMPNARSFCRLKGSDSLGRELISGETRIEFQQHFQQAMRDACEPLGIEIIQALITRIKPPAQIATLVQEREIAKQDEKKFQQQILQQESEQKLRIDEEEREQKGELVKADQEVIKKTTAAKKKQAVELTQANQRLEVAKLRLEAAKDEAAAMIARGKAEAEVIGFQNKAEAAGWKRSVEAFSGDGDQFARYVMLQKLSPAYRRLMINTADSPIMKIFELFQQEKGEAHSHETTPAVQADVPGETPMKTSAK
jgi:regulator of protease activity HflC (stomatin/prohibitin superfamily)